MSNLAISRRATSPLVRLVEGEDRKEANPLQGSQIGPYGTPWVPEIIQGIRGKLKLIWESLKNVRRSNEDPDTIQSTPSPILKPSGSGSKTGSHFALNPFSHPEIPFSPNRT
ncbi:hypothetical protein TNCV_1622131 [Trichonephila clavipes]|nr:hypothetical protein TNCV_1622131 [Trichonephila clavipes]